MNWCMCLSICVCILSLTNSWRNKSESEEHGSSQQPGLALQENLEVSKIIVSSKNDNDRLEFLERELKKMKEENEIFRSRLFYLDETMKQFQISKFGAPAISVKSENGLMKHTKERITDQQITKRVDEILSRSHGNSMDRVVEDMKSNKDPGPVAFFAKLSDASYLGKNQIIHFNDVVTNVGGGYHRLLGIFIAPVKGLYVFHVRAMVAPGKSQYLSIVIDGSSMQILFPNAAGNYDTDSVTIVLEVNKGSAVWVRAESGSSGYLHGHGYSVFSGWLLSSL